MSENIVCEWFTFTNLYLSGDRVAWRVIWKGSEGTNGSLIVLEWTEIGSALSIRTSGMTRTRRGFGVGAEEIIRDLDHPSQEAPLTTVTFLWEIEGVVHNKHCWMLWKLLLLAIILKMDDYLVHKEEKSVLSECISRKDFVAGYSIHISGFMTILWESLFTSYGSFLMETLIKMKSCLRTPAFLSSYTSILYQIYYS